MEYKKLVKDLIERTRENYYSYTGNYEVTDLINSSLGLFVFPEQKFFEKISDDFVSPELFDELKSNTENKYGEENNLKNICNHIRNGIAHFHLEFEAKDNEISKIIINDKPPKSEIYKFKISFSIELLEKFFFEFSQAILDDIKGRRQL